MYGDGMGWHALPRESHTSRRSILRMDRVGPGGPGGPGATTDWEDKKVRMGAYPADGSSGSREGLWAAKPPILGGSKGGGAPFQV